MSVDYGVKDIKTLEGIEAIRLRPSGIDKLYALFKYYSNPGVSYPNKNTKTRIFSYIHKI